MLAPKTPFNDWQDRSHKAPYRCRQASSFAFPHIRRLNLAHADCPQQPYALPFFHTVS